MTTAINPVLNSNSIQMPFNNRIIINTVHISFQNRGYQTDFLIKTNLQLRENLAGSISLTNAWIGIGFNSIKKMVYFIFLIYLSKNILLLKRF